MKKLTARNMTKKDNKKTMAIFKGKKFAVIRTGKRNYGILRLWI